MLNRTVSGLILASLLMSMLTLARNIPSVKSNPRTLIVDDDGPADFHTIGGAINVANAEDAIFVKNGTYHEHVIVSMSVLLLGESAEATIVDGSYVGNVIEVTVDNVTIIGFTVRNSGEQWTDSGIALTQVRNCTISRNKITANKGHGIRLYTSSNNTIIDNNVTANNWGGIWVSTSANHNSIFGNNITANTGNAVWLDASANNSVIGNNIIDNNDGIVLCGPWNNTIMGNNVTASHGDGIRLISSPNNRIFYNNFIENQQSVHTWRSYGNLWDNGYPSGGNYWSDYILLDAKSGSYQNETGSDGIGDTPRIIDANNTDNYPLIGLFSDFKTTSQYYIQTVCNSTISDFQFSGVAILFNVTGEDGTIGFCRICIPTALMNDTYKVFVNGTEVSHTLLPCSNVTHRYLYFTYNHSTNKVAVVPKLPSLDIPLQTPMETMLLLFIMATLLAIIAYKVKRYTVIHKSRRS